MLGITARILGISARRVECPDKQDLAEAPRLGISAPILGILALILGITARILGISARRVECQDKQDLAEAHTQASWHPC